MYPQKIWFILSIDKHDQPTSRMTQSSMVIADDHRSSRMIPQKCHTPSKTIKYTKSQKDRTSFPQKT